MSIASIWAFGVRGRPRRLRFFVGLPIYVPMAPGKIEVNSISARITPMNVSKDIYLSPEQAASRLGCSLSTVRRLVCRGRLRSWRRLGRTVFKTDDIERLAQPKAARPDARAG